MYILFLEHVKAKEITVKLFEIIKHTFRNTDRQNHNGDIFSMSSRSSCWFSSIFTGPAWICDVTVSHTWIWVREAAMVTWQRSWPCFINFFIYLLTILLVPLFSVVSFRSFRFFVSGFQSTCPRQTPLFQPNRLRMLPMVNPDRRRPTKPKAEGRTRGVSGTVHEPRK